MAKKLRKLINGFMVNLLARWLEDFFIFVGVCIVLYTTYEKFGVTIGNYLLGSLLIIFGLLIAKK